MTVEDEIKVLLQQLDQEIAEVKKRLPAHSIKVPIMMELLELEDRRDLLKKELAQLAGKT